jgi:hypothetical protein
VPAPDPQAPGSTGGCKAGGGGGGGFDDGSWTLDGGFAGDDSGTGVGIPIGGGDLASQIALMQIPVSGTYYGWHSQVGPSGTIGGLAYDSNIWWYGWGSSTIGSAFFVVTPGPGSDSSSYWAFAAPWYFNPKGLKGPYPPNSGPTLQKPPINPKEPPPDLKWPNEEEVTLMEQTAHVLKMIAEARVAISVPLFINLCQSSTPVFDPVKHKWSCPGDAIY